jgi:uncharacterized protein
MFARLSDRVTSAVFIALVLAVSATTATIADGLVLALSPLLVVLLMMFVVTRDGYRRDGWRRLGITRAGFRWWPVTLLATAGVSAVSYLIVLALGAASPAAPTAEGWDDLRSLCITGPILAFAEEIGWRGYLQPRLSSWIGRWALLVVGVVWIAWHLPYILFTPSYHADGDRTVVLLLFAGSVLAFSVLFGMLRELSESVWPAVLAHFAHNATFAWVGSALIVPADPVLVNEYLAGDTGLLVLIGTAVCAGGLLIWSARRRAQLMQTVSL